MSLHHRLEGREGASVVVLSSSLGTTLELWDAQVPLLSDRFRILRYDQVGHGRSDVLPGPYTVAGLGGALVALLDELGLERVSFCGLSLGGMVGMWLAASQPARVDRLVLCCTSAYLGARGTWEERAATVRRDGVEAIADVTLGRWFSSGFRAAHPETAARFRAMLCSTLPDGYAACCEALRDWDGRALLGSIEAPTLVVAGTEDPATPPEHAKRLAAGIGGARVEVVAAAHLANVEQPEAVGRAIVDHLACD